MQLTLETMTAFLKRAGINPDGHGEPVGETLEQFTARLKGEDFDPLDFVPVQDLMKEAL